MVSTIETTELQSLPMITRSINGMLELLPGATPMTPIDQTKRSVGNVSFGGSSGTNVSATVDGADNRDPRQGGTLMNFTLESLEQFQLATSQFSAADGRTGGVAISMVTKSGTNVFHGSGFIFARDKALTAKDHFSKEDNLDEVPYSRQQWGGSIGGPILRNRMFFFGAVEYVNEDTSLPVPTMQFDQLELLVAATAAGKIPAGLVNPNHPRSGATPLNLTMYSLKTNLQLTNKHQLMLRFAGQKDTRLNNAFTTPANDLREPEDSFQTFWSAVVQHGWVLGNRGLNQITGHMSHHGRCQQTRRRPAGRGARLRGDAMRDAPSTIDPKEVARFERLAETWWDPNGPMRPLHTFNPVRLRFVRDAACRRFERDGRGLRSLAGVSLLDVGCGGGVLSEPLARLGAAVTGIDPAPANIAVRQAARRAGGGRGHVPERDDRGGDGAAGRPSTWCWRWRWSSTSRTCGLRRGLRPGREARRLLVMATINRTLRSFALAIVGAEYVLGWLPKGTHDGTSS